MDYLDTMALSILVVCAILLMGIIYDLSILARAFVLDEKADRKKFLGIRYLPPDTVYLFDTNITNLIAGYCVIFSISVIAAALWPVSIITIIIYGLLVLIRSGVRSMKQSMADHVDSYHK